MMQNDEQPHRALVGRPLAAVLALGTGLRLFLLGDKGFWIDEIIRLTWSKGHELTRFFDVRPGEIGPALPPLDLGHVFQLARIHNPPLNALLMDLWIRSVGAEGDFAIRLPIAITGALAVLGVYLWACEAFDEQVALLGALLTAVSPQLVHMAQEANHYALPLCLQAFATWCFFRMLRTRARRDEAAFAGLTLLALFAHYYCIIVLFAQGIALWFFWRKEPRRAVIASWALIVPASTLAAYLVVNRQQLREMTDSAVMGQHPVVPFFLHLSVTNLIQPLIGEWPAPITGLVLIVLLGLLTIRAADGPAVERRRAVLITALIPYATTMAAFWIARKNSLLWPRYHSFFAPAFLVTIAAGILSIRPRIVFRAIAICLAASVAFGLHYYYVDFRMEDWRGAARIIDVHADPSDVVIVLPINTTYALARYLKHDLHMFGGDDEPGYFRKLIRAALEAPAVWTVFAWDDATPLAKKLRDGLSCRYPFREDYALNRMSISRYHAAPALESGSHATECATQAPR
jgi:hypothetical protein